MKLRVVVEYDPEAKSYAVYCPELPGCTSAGDTEEEALENIKEAIGLREGQELWVYQNLGRRRVIYEVRPSRAES